MPEGPGLRPFATRGDRYLLKLGRYEIIRELGKGAMGVVYLAKDPLIGRLVALKTIRVGINADDEEVREFRQRFVREAQAAGILSHPNIVTVHDIGNDADSDNSFIAMEFVDGRNLKEILNQARPFTPRDTAEVLSQVAEALSFAHRKGIVHRDVKPANIIVCEGNVAKITDFGIAKIASSVANLTMTGQFLGTPNYMAPEQVKGTAVDGRTDLFSLGVVLYESLTRQKPFGGDSLTTISYKIVHEDYPPPSQVDPRIPERFDRIVARCLQKNPADRYQSGSDLARDLRAAMEDEPAVVAGSASIDQFDGTMVDASRAVTVESPMPHDDHDSDEEGDTAPRPLEERAGSRAAAGAVPWWKIPVPRTPAFAFIGVLVALVALVSALLWSQRVEVPPVDTNREASVAKQRELRLEGQRQIAEGNVEAAYNTYFELRKLAPNSPAVGSTLRNLETLRSMRMSHAQRQAEALQHLEEGRTLYQQKRYAQAIPFFEQAFHLDDTLTAAVNYLRMSREQLSLQRMESRSTPAASTPTEASPAPGQGGSDGTAASAPITLLTLFKSPVADGYFVVNVDGETIIHENLFEERWGFLKRRSARQISVYRQVPQDLGEVEVWVVVPSLNIQERKSITPPVEAGKLNRLTVELDPSSKQLELRWTS